MGILPSLPFSSFSCSLSLYFFSFPHLFYFIIFYFIFNFPLSLIQTKIFSSSGVNLTPYFSTEFSCGHVFGRKEGEVLLIDKTSSWELRRKGGCCCMELQQHAIEFDVEFWPVEHPMEPQDEDRPVKCPISASSSSSINDGKGHEERVVAESSRKRSEQPETEKKGIPVAATEPPVRAVRKRHHTLTTSDNHIMEQLPFVRMSPLPRLPTQPLTISQMLQESDQFNS